MLGGEAADGGLKVDERVEDAPPEAAVGQLAKKPSTAFSKGMVKRDSLSPTATFQSLLY